MSAIIIAAMHDSKPYAAISDIQTSGQSCRDIEVVSVSDAIEQLLGERMHLFFAQDASARFSAVRRVRMEKRENRDAHAVDGMLKTIDRGNKNSVDMMSVEDRTVDGARAPIQPV